MANQATEKGEHRPTSEQLARENNELRSRCQFLERDQQKHKHLAFEWQNFGKYTAQVLKEEVETAGKKIKYLESRVDELKRENKELKDVCLYLDQSEGGDSLLTPPELTELLTQTKFMSKLSLKGRVVSAGGTEPSKISVGGQAAAGMSDLTQAVTVLGEKVERLEKDKLELVKSLSAAHLLVANTQAPSSGHYRGLATPRAVERPPRVGAFLQREGQEEVDGANAVINASPETVANAVMLLDLVQRLEAGELTGFTDSVEGAEVETLKVLISIAWQRIQEQISANEQ